MSERTKDTARARPGRGRPSAAAAADVDGRDGMERPEGPAGGPARRRLPVGAEPFADGGVSFRVWAPDRRSVAVVLERLDLGSEILTEPVERPLARREGGYFEGFVPEAGAGARYRFRLDGDEGPFPDPASRWQPEGPHGPSVVVDPSAFRWTDHGWPGPPRPKGPGSGPVIYELHVGTFTPEGTWAAAAGELPGLRELGVTVLEVMPVADFPGRFGWGYDGVCQFAPYHGYGEPDDARRFVDAAHRAGLAVILDVVYNHFGPDGNYIGRFAPAFFSPTRATEWGQALDFDGPGREGVRAFFGANVRHWIGEYHFDGFRFDATHAIEDASPEHVLAELARAARDEAGARGVLLVAENEAQDARLVRARGEGGYDLDLIGNEDFHHAALVAMTGRREGYYSSHRGTPQEIVSAVKRGFLYQGQWYPWQSQPRGTSTRGLARSRLLHFLENHDQVANTARGERLVRLTSPGRWRAFTALQLLSPESPLLFQGQEFASSAPFLYFADHGPELAEAVRDGRRAFLSQFPSVADPDVAAALDDPADPATFERCRLDPGERARNTEALALHRDLLSLRRADGAFSGELACELDGAVLGERALLLRWIAPDGRRDADRLLLLNWGEELDLVPAPEPLLAPPPGLVWTRLWSSESPRYGGGGARALDTRRWTLPAETALVLAPAVPGESGAEEGA